MMGGVTPVYSQGPVAPSASTFQITLAKLGYGEKTLNSPYGSTQYTLRVPEGWEMGVGSLFELEVSYAYNRTDLAGTQSLPSLLANIIVVVDDQTQRVFPINEAVLDHAHVPVELPPSLLNDPDDRTHDIKVTLDASDLCNVPHKAHLTIHTASSFSLVYDPLPIVADLARYPRPFYQQSFEPDQVRFVLPAQPAQSDVNGAVAIAARLGSLGARMVISGTTDQELLGQLDLNQAAPHEHLIVIGSPDTNELIPKLSNLGVLPVRLRERQLNMSSQGPLAVAPGGTLTYTLMITNTSQQALSSVAIVGALPADAQVVSCSPACSEAVKGQVTWSIPSWGADEASSFTLGLRLSETIEDSIVENTFTLLDAASSLLNLSTLTTTVTYTVPSELGLSFSAPSRYFFAQAEQAVPENDGVVQELVSPWDQTRAILVITGLSHQAVYKASQALSLRTRFPGMQGSWALVRDVRPLPDPSPAPPSTDMTFLDLGYGDKIFTGYSDEASYFLDIPVGWSLTEEAFLDLHFVHSARLHSSSSMNVLFNGAPIATIALTDETRLDGRLQVKLPASQARPGSSNRVLIQVKLQPLDACGSADMWLMVSSASLVHLDHRVRSTRLLDLGLYPYPFDQQPDMADVLVVLPAQPTREEWEASLRLAAGLGDVVGGANFAPALVLGSDWPQDKLGDYHLIIIGRPSRSPLLQQVNKRLPQPFLPDSDSIEQKLNQVTFRLPPDVSLGYIQLIPSPWNEARALLAIVGTTDQGTQAAVDALVHQPWNLKGNLTLVREGTVSTIDTRLLTKSGAAMAVVTAVPQMSPVPTGTIASAPAAAISTPDLSTSRPAPQVPGRPAWLLPLMGISGLAILATLFIAYWQARRARS